MPLIRPDVIARTLGARDAVEVDSRGAGCGAGIDGGAGGLEMVVAGPGAGIIYKQRIGNDRIKARRPNNEVALKVSITQVIGEHLVTALNAANFVYAVNIIVVRNIVTYIVVVRRR